MYLCPRAADWKLDAPDWTGRMRVTARGKVAYVKLEDKISGEREADRTVPLFTGTVAVVNHFTVFNIPLSVTHLFQGDPAHVQACSLF